MALSSLRLATIKIIRSRIVTAWIIADIHFFEENLYNMRYLPWWDCALSSKRQSGMPIRDDPSRVFDHKVVIEPSRIGIPDLLKAKIREHWSIRPLLIGDEKKPKMTKNRNLRRSFRFSRSLEHTKTKMFFIFDPFFRRRDTMTKNQPILCSIINLEDAIPYTYHLPRLSWLRGKGYRSQEM